MGMFGYMTGFMNESSIDESAIVAEECTESNFFAATVRACAESTANYTNIMMAVGMDELEAYTESGATYVQESSDGFFNKVKEFFKKLIAKIKGIFEKFIAVVSQWTKSDSSFVSKYKKQISTASTKDFKFQGYKFTIKSGVDFTGITSTSEYTAAITNLGGDNLSGITKEKIEETREDQEDILDAVRQTAVNLVSSNTNYSSSTVSSSEFAKELSEALRDGDSAKQEIGDDVVPSQELAKIINTADVKKRANDAYKTIIKAIDADIKNVEKLQKAALAGLKDGANREENANKTAAAGVQVSLMENSKQIATQAFGAYIQAVKDENRQAKAICVKLITRKVKNEQTSMSEGASFLSGVHMI